MPPPSRPNITMKDLAQRLGVSPGTVCKALRNDPEISLVTRERILAAANELGYRRNAAAATLSQFRGSSKVKPVTAGLAWLNFWRDPTHFHSIAEFALYWRGAEACAQKFGYRLEEFACAELSLDRISKILTSRGIEGVLLPPMQAHPEPRAELVHGLNQFKWQDFSVVGIGRRPEPPAAHFVTSAQVWNARLALDEIFKHGYERVGFVGHHHFYRMFGAGYVWSQSTDHSHRAQLSPFLLRDHYRKEQNRFEKWLKAEQPDAIFTEISDLPEMLMEAGRRIPEDIALAGTSTHDCRISAGVNQNPEEIGRVSVLVLLSAMQDHAVGIPPIRREVLVQGSWQDGDSMPWKKKHG